MNNKKTYDIFVFCCGKSGSKTLLKTLGQYFSTIHCHHLDEYKNNSYKNNISGYGEEHTIFDVIEESMKQKEKVYIFDSYRTPIERKISSFFHHIENGKKLLPNYKNLTIKQIQKFFNNKYLKNIEDYVSMNDCFKYFNIEGFTKYVPDSQYQIYNYKNIVFVKMYFENIQIWGELLSEILNLNINICKNNESKNYNYFLTYKNFLKSYKVPKKYLLEVVQNNSEFHKFVSPQKRCEYINKWLLRTCNDKYNCLKNPIFYYN